MVCQLIQDHPRRCGENKEAQAIKVLCTGSPPQVRGKLFQKIARICVCRITPAGAGKTFSGISMLPTKWDHPRRCGENLLQKNCFKKTLGSPPQVRGKLVCKVFNLLSIRITPAGAGKTYIFSGFPTVAKDHPRRCGENLFFPFQTLQQ